MVIWGLPSTFKESPFYWFAQLLPSSFHPFNSFFSFPYFFLSFLCLFPVLFDAACGRDRAYLTLYGQGHSPLDYAQNWVPFSVTPLFWNWKPLGDFTNSTSTITDAIPVPANIMILSISSFTRPGARGPGGPIRPSFAPPLWVDLFVNYSEKELITSQENRTTSWHLL